MTTPAEDGIYRFDKALDQAFWRGGRMGFVVGFALGIGYMCLVFSIKSCNVDVPDPASVGCAGEACMVGEP